MKDTAHAVTCFNLKTDLDNRGWYAHGFAPMGTSHHIEDAMTKTSPPVTQALGTGKDVNKDSVLDKGDCVLSEVDTSGCACGCA